MADIGIQPLHVGLLQPEPLPSLQLLHCTLPFASWSLRLACFACRRTQQSALITGAAPPPNPQPAPSPGADSTLPVPPAPAPADSPLPFRLSGCRYPCPIVDFAGFTKPVGFRGSSGFGGGGRSSPQTLHPPHCHLYFHPLFLLPKLHSLNCSYKTRTRDLTYLSYVTWIHDPRSYELEQLASTNIISVLCPSLTLNKISD